MFHIPYYIVFQTPRWNDIVRPDVAEVFVHSQYKVFAEVANNVKNKSVMIGSVTIILL